MKKALLIVNPFAGKNRAKGGLLDIVRILNRGRYAVTTLVTEYRGHATVIAQGAKNWDIIICFGGDGTLNEVITGMLRGGCRIPLGYIPAGSTNDFANSLRLSKNIKEAARDIVMGQPTPVDVGMFGDKYFTYVASFGAFTKASYATPYQAKKALGHAAYVLEGVKEIPEIRAERASFSTPEGDFEGEYIWGAVANTTSIGGVVTIAPKVVRLDDGKFELLLIRKPNSVNELNQCIISMLTQNYDCDLIDFISTDRVTVTSGKLFNWTLDGEKVRGQNIIEVKNIKHAIDIVI
ncbi:MAG: diacylglycerol kinase family lipid kinase [Clostridia bacterium]|nr:diacylglycerol kinase family lipid kinase [Clostridia bacterium]